MYLGWGLCLLQNRVLGHWEKGSKPCCPRAQGKTRCCLEEGKRRTCLWRGAENFPGSGPFEDSCCWRRAGNSGLQKTHLRHTVQLSCHGKEDSLSTKLHYHDSMTQDLPENEAGPGQQTTSQPLPPVISKPYPTQGGGVGVGRRDKSVERNTFWGTGIGMWIQSKAEYSIQYCWIQIQ